MRVIGEKKIKRGAKRPPPHKPFKLCISEKKKFTVEGIQDCK